MKTVRTQQLRIAELDQKIASAEARLRTLRDALEDLREQKGLAALNDALLENERLQEQHTQAAQEADRTHAAALKEAFRASETDVLTGLPNRASLWNRLTHDIAIARRHQAHVAVYFIDIDGFKQINDQLGHEAGDHLLRHVAGCLASTLRASDSVFRLGGDEFLVIVPDINPGHVAVIARKIAEAISRPCAQSGQLVKVQASIGTSLYPQDGADPQGLVRKADAAMYDAKRSSACAS